MFVYCLTDIVFRTKINAQDAQGKTALHEASRWGHLEVVCVGVACVPSVAIFLRVKHLTLAVVQVKFLISKGADPTLKTTEGTTILHLVRMHTLHTHRVL
jgi:ankyrin repeat protein